jgi:hypothetical protein
MKLTERFFEDRRIENPYEDKMVNISWSQIRMFYNCPRSFKLKYIDKKSENPINIYLVFGSALHIVLQKYIRVMYDNSVKQANELDLEYELKEEMKKEFINHKNKNHKLEITLKEMEEFLSDGIDIIRFFKKNRSKYFSTKKVRLLGIETQLHKKLKDDRFDKKSLYFLGYIDLLLYYENERKIKIIDIKTSTKGWGDYKKKDKNTVEQIIAYKKYLADEFDLDINDIDVSYLILRRKINQDIMYPPKRIQEYSPANGSISLKKVDKKINKFVNYVFDEDLKYRKDVSYPAIEGYKQMNCTFCEFKNKPELCNPKERLNEIDFGL